MKRLTVLVLGCFFLAGASAEAQQKAKKEDVPKYIKQLTAKDAKERIAACEALAEIGELKKAYAKDAYEPLAHAVSKDGDPGVRAKAAEALGRIDADPTKAVPALIEGLKDKDRNVQVASANALGALGPGAKDAVDALKELSKEAREEQEKAKEEQAKFTKDGDKEKAKLAQNRAQNAQRLNQATTQALRSIAGK
jgi:HEAT repeat protein